MNTREPLMPVAKALARITSALEPLPPETVGVADAHGRVLAADVRARVTQPPIAVSAMDGYAVRASDVASVPVTLKQIGEAPAGRAFGGSVGLGSCVRIFTGAPVPDGADTIVIQENVDTNGPSITVRETASKGLYVRPAGLDFREGEVLLRAGRRLGARDVGLAAAMNVPWLEVRRRPRVALLATGDEIVRPGEAVGPNQIVSSNALALAGLIKSQGGVPIDLGIALDTRDSLQTMADGARGTDLLITMGGASVGDHDLVQSVLGEQGLEIDFWRIAMRPGKPLMFGKIGPTPMLGLPGNPVSSLVCALIFVVPALGRMLGTDDAEPAVEIARLGSPLGANDRRQDYLRAKLGRDAAGNLVATPFEKQDSSMLRLLTESQCLVIRPPDAAAASDGDTVRIIRLDAATPDL